MPVSTRIFPAGSSTASINAMTEASVGSDSAAISDSSGLGLNVGFSSGLGLVTTCDGLGAVEDVASLGCLGLVNAIPAMIRTPSPSPMMNGF